MTSVSTGYALTGGNVSQIDTSKLTPIKLSEEQREQFFGRIEKMLEGQYRRPPDTSNHPAYRDYATVQVNGKVVATIDNHGFVQSSNSVGAKISGKLADSDNGKTGPALAQARADMIAGMLGGSVVKSPSALTQQQFNGLSQPTSSVDYGALQADPLYQNLMRTKQAETAFLAQQIAQTSEAEQADAVPAADDAAVETDSPAVKAFLDYMAKSPEERYFDAFLKSKGMTEEEFQALPPEEKQALMTEFEEAVKQRVENDSAEKLAEAERAGLL
jgi:hypothetical protein